MALEYAYRNYIDGLEKVMIAPSVGRTSMPASSAMTEVGEVYEGGVEFKREASQKQRHFQEGKFEFAKKTQSRKGVLTASFKMLIYDLDKLAAIAGGTVTKTGTTGTVGKAKYVASAGFVAKPMAVTFRSTTIDGIGADPSIVDTPIDLNIYRAKIDVMENFVMNDKSVWLADVTLELESTYEIDGVAVDVTGTAE